MLSIAADVVLFLHAAYVAFVVLGLVAVLVGYVLKWQWIKNGWFRIIHLTMILIVTVEALLGVVCPLTTLENELRRAAGQSVRTSGFMAQLVHDLLFYDAPPWMFTVGYCIFALLVASTWMLVPPSFVRASFINAEGNETRSVGS